MIHFESRATKPRVFRMTPSLIEDAKQRNAATVQTSFGEDWMDPSVLRDAVGIVAAADVIADSRFPKRQLAEAAPQLRWIHVTGAGIEPLLPLDWLPATVTLTNNSGVHAEKMRESALMMLLMLHARMPAIVTNQRTARWEQIFTSRIRGRTVLVIGVGDMGGAVAVAAHELGMRVLGVRHSGAPHPSVDRMVRSSEIDDVLPQAEFVVSAVPLTPDTSRLIDRRRFALMKAGAGFINIGRAGSVDYESMAEALATGHLSGAIVDVFDSEPLSSSSMLWTVPNLIMTPHVCSDDEREYLPKTLDLVFENYGRLRRGEDLINTVEPARGY